jgi:hypothetical protein
MLHLGSGAELILLRLLSHRFAFEKYIVSFTIPHVCNHWTCLQPIAHVKFETCTTRESAEAHSCRNRALFCHCRNTKRSHTSQLTLSSHLLPCPPTPQRPLLTHNPSSPPAHVQPARSLTPMRLTRPKVTPSPTLPNPRDPSLRREHI